jgi:hypothetical protein
VRLLNIRTSERRGKENIIIKVYYYKKKEKEERQSPLCGRENAISRAHALGLCVCECMYVERVRFGAGACARMYELWLLLQQFHINIKNIKYN